MDLGSERSALDQAPPGGDDDRGYSLSPKELATRIGIKEVTDAVLLNLLEL